MLDEFKVILSLLFAANLTTIFFVAQPPSGEALYFLDVGQGDATLLMTGSAAILTDAGPTRSILEKIPLALQKNKYIDLGIITHPELDHFNGFNFLLDEYDFGAILWNGRIDRTDSREWNMLLEKIEGKNVPLIVLGEKDSIRNNQVSITILSPGEEFKESGERNQTSVVEFIRTSKWSALLTGDIDGNVEKFLAKKYDLGADILKVAHHGSKYSSTAELVKDVAPKISVIQVGIRNPYGHPTAAALDALRRSEAVFRTDLNGTIKIMSTKNTLQVFTER